MMFHHSSTVITTTATTTIFLVIITTIIIMLCLVNYHHHHYRNIDSSWYYHSDSFDDDYIYPMDITFIVMIGGGLVDAYSVGWIYNHHYHHHCYTYSNNNNNNYLTYYKFRRSSNYMIPYHHHRYLLQQQKSSPLLLLLLLQQKQIIDDWEDDDNYIDNNKDQVYYYYHQNSNNSMQQHQNQLSPPLLLKKRVRTSATDRSNKNSNNNKNNNNTTKQQQKQQQIHNNNNEKYSLNKSKYKKHQEQNSIHIQTKTTTDTGSCTIHRSSRGKIHNNNNNNKKPNVLGYYQNSNTNTNTNSNNSVDVIVNEILRVVPHYHPDSTMIKNNQYYNNNNNNNINNNSNNHNNKIEYNTTQQDIIWKNALHIYDSYCITKDQQLQQQQQLVVNNRVHQNNERIYMAMVQVCIEMKNVSNAIYFLQNRILTSYQQQHVQMKDSTLSVPSTTAKVLSPRIWAAILKICAITGDDTTAYDILHIMNQYGEFPNVRHCTFYLTSLMKSKKVYLATQFLIYMTNLTDTTNEQYFVKKIQLQPYTSMPDMIAVKTVLNGCSTNYTLVRDICTNIKHGIYGTKVQLDISCYNILLSSCPNTTYIPDIFREIKLSRRHRYNSIYPTIITYTKAITICRKDSNLSYTQQLLSMARNDERIIPDTFMYTSAIWVAAQCNNATAALDIYNEMIQYNITPSVVTYNGVLSALASSFSSNEENDEQRYDSIVSIYQQMKQQQRQWSLTTTTTTTTRGINIQPNSVTYFHITRGLQNIQEDEERLAHLWRIYALMDKHDRQIKVGSRLLEALIVTYGTIGHYEEALYVFKSINGVADKECIRAILFACSVADPPQWEMALSILHTSDIVADGTGPGLVEAGALCNTMLACSKAGRWEESLQLLRLYGVRSDVSIVAVNSLIAACGRAGRPDMSMEVLYEVEGWDMKLDTRSYRSAIIACNQAEHVYRRSLKLQEDVQQQKLSTTSGFEWWECAISLLRRMKENGLHPDTSTLSSTISSCEAAGQWQRALQILQSAMNENSTMALNVYCFNAAISACEKGSAWVEALEIYEKMKERGGSDLRPNTVTVSSLILALDNAGQKEFAVSIYREGLRKSFILSPWRTTKDTITNDPIQAMDLHSYSAAMARAAIRNHINNVLFTTTSIALLPTLKEKLSDDSGTVTLSNKTTNTTAVDDWIIIVGQGYHSEDGRPILKDVVMNLFQLEYGIKVRVDEYNSGRIIVPGSQIEQYVMLHRSTTNW